MEDLVPLFAIVFLFGAPVAAWIISRVLAHQERMAMIRQGYMPPPDPRAMRRGTWQGAPPPPPGPGMQMPPPTVGMYDPTYYAQAQLRKGITITFIGFAVLIGLSFTLHGSPGPQVLGGLVPMFVGIAQIINAVINGARLPGMIGNPSASQHANFGPAPGPMPGPGAPPPPEPPSGPYAWRPGPTPEIEKPASPPDYRG
ncbi:MAG: hypothetical protein KGN02_04590 [bacterium]|nr:hypothetical protein [bacterium]